MFTLTQLSLTFLAWSKNLNEVNVPEKIESNSTQTEINTKEAVGPEGTGDTTILSIQLEELNKIPSLQEKVEENFQVINEYVERLSLLLSFSEQLESYLVNPTINQKNFREWLDYMAVYIFSSDSIQNLAPPDVEAFASIEVAIQSILEEIESLYSEINTILESLAQDDSIEEELISQIEADQKYVRQRLDKFKEEFSGKLVSRKDVLELVFSAKRLYAHNFQQVFNYPFKGDYLEMDMSIKSREEEIEYEENIGKVEIPVPGGVKVNATVGVNFGSFFDGINTYSNNEGKIAEVSSHSFIPYLATSLLFYKRKRKFFNCAGSFGIGFPIDANDGDNAGIAFMGGLNAIFGKEERAIISFGLIGGKINRLDGVKVNDEIDATAEVPTKAVYQLGAYLGFAYNLSVNRTPNGS